MSAEAFPELGLKLEMGDQGLFDRAQEAMSAIQRRSTAGIAAAALAVSGVGFAAFELFDTASAAAGGSVPALSAQPRALSLTPDQAATTAPSPATVASCEAAGMPKIKIGYTEGKPDVTVTADFNESADCVAVPGDSAVIQLTEKVAKRIPHTHRTHLVTQNVPHQSKTLKSPVTVKSVNNQSVASEAKATLKHRAKLTPKIVAKHLWGIKETIMNGTHKLKTIFSWIKPSQVEKAGSTVPTNLPANQPPTTLGSNATAKEYSNRLDALQAACTTDPKTSTRPLLMADTQLHTSSKYGEITMTPITEADGMHPHYTLTLKGKAKLCGDILDVVNLDGSNEKITFEALQNNEVTDPYPTTGPNGDLSRVQLTVLINSN